jgi:hypothetical protein
LVAQPLFNDGGNLCAASDQSIFDAGKLELCGKARANRACANDNVSCHLFLQFNRADNAPVSIAAVRFAGSIRDLAQHRSSLMATNDDS